MFEKFGEFDSVEELNAAAELLYDVCSVLSAKPCRRYIMPFRCYFAHQKSVRCRRFCWLLGVRSPCVFSSAFAVEPCSQF